MGREDIVMRPGYMVYEHRILVDLDDAEMLRLAELDILKGLEDDIEMGQLEGTRPWPRI
jgi:hypothetical protein